MVVYIITFHRAVSHGAFLQSFALQNAITNLGYETTIIDYCPKRFRYTSFALHTSGSFLAKLLKFIPSFFAKTRMYLISKKACENNLKMTDKTFRSLDELMAYDFGNAIFVSGSDQIWDIRYEEDLKNVLPYYLSFARGTKISYASSCGEMDFVENKNDFKYQSIFRELLQYKMISVREQKHAAQLNECDSRFNAKLMPDPTFLLSINEWNCFLRNKRCFPNKYILVYGLYRNKRLHDYAKSLSLKYGYRVISISSTFDYYPKEKNVSDCNPFSLLELIRDSECVITDSFHGCALSLIFNKNIHIFVPPSSKERILNLTSMFEIENRIVDNSLLLIDNDMDYEKINKSIHAYRQRGMSFLSTGLNDKND